MPVSKKIEKEFLTGFPAPWWSGSNCALYLGDTRECLRRLPARSVHCVVCSPPYWGLRDYGKPGQIGLEEYADCGTYGRAQCGNCFVCSMVDVFSEVQRVLRDDGTLWLNLGDTFDNGQLLVPTRVALALTHHDWKLVQDIIWYSPNKIPESVENRLVKSHEHIFLLSKGPNYYFDYIAVQEQKEDGRRVNKRDVWTIPIQGYPGAHFATYTPKLITPCILAGTSEHGCCGNCARPYERVVVRIGGTSNLTGGIYAPPGQAPHGNAREDNRDRSFDWSRNGKPGSGSTLDGTIAAKETAGWRKACGCQTDEVVPPVVLDPFVGSGTTVATALELGRAGIGMDLSEVYLQECAVPRITAVHVPNNKPTNVLTALAPAPRRLPGM